MSKVDSQIYASWRAQSLAAFALSESGHPDWPSERLLQEIWHHQRLLRDQLVTLDGRRLLVLHPGFRNQESGPDFKRSVIQIEPGSPRCGDVEIDLTPGLWSAHHHDRNPAYLQVQLRVVWKAEPPCPSAIPILTLSQVLDADLDELKLWFGSESAHVPPAYLIGRCSAGLRALDPSSLADLLQQAAQARLETKAAQLRARAKQVGVQNCLWESLFQALGYKQNTWPMQRLAELLPLLTQGSPATDAGDTVAALQARLFGVAGLLPGEWTSRRGLSPAAPGYWRETWARWWRDQADYAGAILPRETWQLHSLRPTNQPLRRLALAAHWLSNPGLTAGIEQWISVDRKPSAAFQELLALLQVDRDPFWSWHWSLRAPSLAKPRPLLGTSRLTDIAMNAVLPWLWMRATAGRNEEVRSRVARLYFSWPAGQDNAVLRLTRRRLFATDRPVLPRTAAMQQGLLQITRDFCDQANALCDGCRFPDLLTAAAVAPAAATACLPSSGRS